jgi:hypothetical protein
MGGQVVQIRAEELPKILIMPTWAAPGLLRGVSTEGEFEGVRLMMANTIGQTNRVDGINLKTKLNMTSFARLLAKIAHGFAWSNFQSAGFKFMLTDLIRGLNFDAGSMLVGGSYRQFSVENLPENSRESLHYLEAADWSIAGNTYLVADICLFLPFGGPTYSVVIGQHNGCV